MSKERLKKARGGDTEDKEWDGSRGKTASDRAPAKVYAGAGSHVAAESEGEMTGDRESTDKDRDEDKRGGRAKKKSGGAVDHSAMAKHHEAEAKRHHEAGNHDIAKEHEKLAKLHSEKRGTEGRFERAEHKRGGHVAELHGEGAKKRLDRPARKRGGGVGSDITPLSSAAKTKDRRDDGEAAITGGD